MQLLSVLLLPARYQSEGTVQDINKLAGSRWRSGFNLDDFFSIGNEYTSLLLVLVSG